MKQKSLTVLFVAAALVVAAAGFAVNARRTSNAAPDDRGAFVPGLAGDRVNDVAKIRVEKGEDTTTIARDGSSWVVSDRGNYPARFEGVKEAIVAMSRLEITEAKTKNPDLYHKLGVEDPGPDTEATRVVFEDASGSVLADVIVGDTRYVSRDQFVYVRNQGEAQAFQCEGRMPTLNADAKSWLERDIVKLDTQELRDVRLVHPDGEEIQLERMAPDSTQFVVANLPEGREEKFTGVGNSIASNLASLQMDDVRPVSEVDFEAEPVSTVEYVKKNGQVIVVQAARFEDTDWVRLSSIYREPPPAPTMEGPELPEGAEGEDDGAAPMFPPEEPAEEEAPDPAEVRQEIENFNARVTAWAYALPSYKFGNLNKRMDDLMKELEVEAREGAREEGRQEEVVGRSAPRSGGGIARSAARFRIETQHLSRCWDCRHRIRHIPGEGMVQLGLSMPILGLAGCVLVGCGGGGAADPAPEPVALAAEFGQRHAPVDAMRVLVVSVDYFDDVQAPFARSGVQAMLDTVGNLLAAESANTTSLVADIYEVMMPHPTAHYSGANDLPVRLRRDALNAAGFGMAVPPGYDRVAFVGPRVWSMPFRAFQVGHVFFLSELNAQLFVHELMHTYDRPHTDSFNPASDVPNDGQLAYGDGADFMGDVPVAHLAIAPKSLHARARWDLGWLGSDQIVRFDHETGPYSRVVHLQSLGSGVGQVAMVLPTARGDQRYWVQLRGEQILLQGPVISLVQENSIGSIRLLDPTPTSDALSWKHAFLKVGVPFTTPEGITLETLQHTHGDAATVLVTVPAGLDLATDQPPVIGLGHPGVTTDIVSGVTTFEISAHDPDLTELENGSPEHFDGIASILLEVVGSDQHGNPLVLWSQTADDPTDRFAFDTTWLGDNVYEFRITAVPEQGVSGSVSTTLFVVNGMLAESYLRSSLAGGPSWRSGCDVDSCR